MVQRVGVGYFPVASSNGYDCKLFQESLSLKEVLILRAMKKLLIFVLVFFSIVA